MIKKNDMKTQEGCLVISLDFELLWGIKDLDDYQSYAPNILNGRNAIPKLLKIFSENGIHATWATVGYLVGKNKDDISSFFPKKKPVYSNEKLSTYNHFEDVGLNESEDPLSFAGSLLNLIKETDGQELASHTFSHYYCCEEGADCESFQADVHSAIEILQRNMGVTPCSIVFPRNQCCDSMLELLPNCGLTSYRGNPSKGYRFTKNKLVSLIQRGIRFFDSYFPLLGNHIYDIPDSAICPLNIPASVFFRPCSSVSFLERRKIRRIKHQMKKAAQQGKMFHLWWHPHNMGSNTELFLKEMQEIVCFYRELHEIYGYMSLSMNEYAQKIIGDKNG